MLKTYQFKTRCKYDSHSSKTATVILPVDLFRGYGVLTSPKLPFPIDLLRRPYNSVRTGTAMRHCDSHSAASLLQSIEFHCLRILFVAC